MMRLSRCAALHLSDNRIQIELITIRYVAEHRLDRFQIHGFVFSVHILICLPPLIGLRAAPHRFKQQYCRRIGCIQ